MQTVSVPVTGREDVTVARPPLRALIGFYAAFNARDLDALRRNWADGDEVVMDNPVGGVIRGKEAIMEVYRRIAQSPAKVYVEFTDYTLHEAGEMFYVVGRERGTFEVNGQPQALVIRTSRIFRRFGGEWRQVHHHGSIDDADLLARYQAAVAAK